LLCSHNHGDWTTVGNRQENIGFNVIGIVNQFTKLCNDVVYYPGPELELILKIRKQAVILMPKNVHQN